MPRFLATVLCFTLLVACGKSAVPPSLVLVTLDTVRCDHLGAYGSERGLSPHLDALAEGGLVHEAAFTTMPTTGPAHLSLLTGLYPSEHGSLANGEPLAADARSRELALRLAARGYATAAFVTTPILQRRATGLQGFEIYDVPRGVLRSGDEAVRAALAWLAVERRRPVFLWVHLYDAHAPYGTADEKRRSFPVAAEDYGWVAAERFADPPRRAEMARRYAAGVSSADAALGRLLAGMEPFFETAPLVVVTGDHGEALDERLASRGYAYDHGEFLDADVVCVPLVVAGPGVEAGRSAGAVSLVDVYATLAAAAELAGEEPARDLRRAGSERRIVAVERRRVAPGARASVRAHAAAAFDGHGDAIVGETQAREPAGADPQTRELFRTALRHWAALGRRPGAGGLDPELRESLEALGYTE